jgi:hypothetical protein
MVASGVRDKEAGDVSRFLNRILGLSVEKQNLVIHIINVLMHITVSPLEGSELCQHKRHSFYRFSVIFANAYMP